MTGGARPMAEGGVAKFEQGGFASGSLGERYGFTSFPRGIETTMIPSLTPTRTFTQNPGAEALGMEWRTGVEAAYDPENPTEMSLGHLLNETAGEKVNRIFPDYARTTQTLSFDELNPGFQQAADQGEPTSRFVEEISRGLGEARSWVQGSVEEMGQDVEAVWGYLFSGETRADGTNLGQTRAVLEMIQRRPDLEGDIKIFARQAVSENPELSPNELSSVVAMSLSDKHEGRPNVGYAHVAADTAMDLVGQGLSIGPAPPPDALIADSKITEERVKELFPNIDDESLAHLMENAKSNPEADLGYLMQPNLMFPEDLIDSFRATPGETGEGEGEIVVADSRKVPKSPFDGTPSVSPPSVKQPAFLVSASGGSPADVITETFDNPDMSPEEATKTLADYKKEFIDEMPQYEGMSEAEKGWAIAEAGFKVAAGTSEHALTNIAEGLKGLGATFAKDAAEQKRWDRTVNLSAAKYAFENVKSDRTKAEALAKERRARIEYVANKPGTDPRNGRKFEKGDVLTFNVGEIHDGVLSKFNSGTVVLPKTFSDIQAGISAANKLLTSGRIKYGDYQEDRSDYQAASKQLLSGLQMKLLLGDAAQIIQDNPKSILGGTAFLKRATDDVLNTLGIQQSKRTGWLKDIRSNDSAKYQSIMRRIGTKMITQILNEGNRTVSDNDRKRVDELVGAYGDYFSGVPGSESALRVKIIGLAKDIDDGLFEAASVMNDLEATYNTNIERERYELLLRYKQDRFSRSGIDTTKSREDTAYGLKSREGRGLQLGEDGIWRLQVGGQ